MSTEYKFEGWMGDDEKAAEGNMVWREYEPKKWQETDIDIRITHCGVCGSDVHVLRSGWVRWKKDADLRKLTLTQSPAPGTVPGGCRP